MYDSTKLTKLSVNKTAGYAFVSLTNRKAIMHASKELRECFLSNNKLECTFQNYNDNNKNPVVEV